MWGGRWGRALVWGGPVANGGPGSPPPSRPPPSPPPPTADVPAPSSRVGAPPAGAKGLPGFRSQGLRSTKCCQERKARFIGGMGRPRGRAGVGDSGGGDRSAGGGWETSGAKGICGMKRVRGEGGLQALLTTLPPWHFAPLSLPGSFPPPAQSELQGLAEFHRARCFYRLRVDRPAGFTESRGVRRGTP
jgi:hypothetical protein